MELGDEFEIQNNGNIEVSGNAKVGGSLLAEKYGVFNPHLNDSSNIVSRGSWGGVTLVDGAKSWSAWVEGYGDIYRLGKGATGGARTVVGEWTADGLKVLGALVATDPSLIQCSSNPYLIDQSALSVIEGGYGGGITLRDGAYRLE